MTLAPIRPNVLFAVLCLGALAMSFGCGSSSPAKPVRGDRALTEAIVAARTAFQQDRIGEAATFYALALTRARALDLPSAIGDAAYNLGACLLRQHEYERAEALLAEAHYELARADVSLADVILLQARAARLNGDVPAAEMFMQQLLTDPRSRPSEAHISQATLLKGQMACDRGDWAGARDLLDEARTLLGPDTETLLRAQLVALTGRVAMGIQDYRTAADAFDQQADLLRHAGQYRALGYVLAQAGDAREALNEHTLAADRFYRAARTASAWDEPGSAKTWAQAALAAAHQADDAARAGLAESLLSELTPAEPARKP